MKHEIKTLILLLLYTIFCVVLGYNIRRHDNKNNKKIVITDTIYNKKVIDSIQFDINKLETTIVDIKKRYEYEKEQALNDSDSAAVKRFLELAGSDD